jgi:hypothetical protein
MRFGLYNKLLTVMLQPDKLLQNIASCVSETLACVQELRPESFTIVQLDKELAIMAMLHAFPCNVYSNFALSLMRHKTLTHADLEATFQVKQIKYNAQDGPLICSAALCTFGKPSSPCGNSNKCPFCTIKGHTQEDCYKYKSACNKTVKLVNKCKANMCGRDNKCKGKANRTKAEEEGVVKKAQHAQVCLATSPSLSADAHWIADTGARSCMMLH